MLAPESDLISASIFVCANVLREADGVLSAIRIIDVFFADRKRPPGLPDNAVAVIEAHALVILKGRPTEKTHTLALQLIAPNGETKNITESPIEPRFTSRFGPDVPGGNTIDVELNIGVNMPGTYWVRALFDGAEVARAPFTLIRRSQSQQATG